MGIIVPETPNVSAGTDETNSFAIPPTPEEGRIIVPETPDVSADADVDDAFAIPATPYPEAGPSSALPAPSTAAPEEMAVAFQVSEESKKALCNRAFWHFFL